MCACGCVCEFACVCVGKTLKVNKRGHNIWGGMVNTPYFAYEGAWICNLSLLIMKGIALEKEYTIEIFQWLDNINK